MVRTAAMRTPPARIASRPTASEPGRGARAARNRAALAHPARDIRLLDRRVVVDILESKGHEARRLDRCQAPRLRVDVALEIGCAAQLDHFDLTQRIVMRWLEDNLARAATMHPHMLGEVRVDQDRVELQSAAVGCMHEFEMEAIGVGRPGYRYILGQARLQ